MPVDVHGVSMASDIVQGLKKRHTVAILCEVIRCGNASNS